jgi:ABC-type polysaccharide/polyol phosphate transport system ATPase subunit
MSRPLLELDQVTVRYRINPGGVHSVKDWITSMSHPFRTIPILKDLNLKLMPGQSLGIMGRNGSGKSTLLRTVAGIIKPSSGIVRVNGSIAPILALGAGLEPELTGHENIRLLLALQGRVRTKAATRDIAAFSELDEATLDQPTKTYSSGMLARLSFSIAFSQNCDIYIIDEVLAVGDLGFQQKCLQRIESLQQSGKTFLFVSHFPEEVERICNRAILLEQGRLIGDGSAREICQQYRHLF